MKKAENEKSNGFGTDRERLPSAESNFEERIYEVHSGVGLANRQ